MTTSDNTPDDDAAWQPPDGAQVPPSTDPQPVELEGATDAAGGGSGSRTPWRIVVGAIGALVVLAGVAFAATQFGGDESPEDVVQDFFDAIADEDALGMLAAMDSGERSTLLDPVQTMFDEFERLEILDSSFELDGIAGIDFEFENLSFRAEEVRDDVVRVYIESGTATASYDTDEIPIGDFLIDIFERLDVDYTGQSDSETSDMVPDEEFFLAVHDAGDGWGVSLGYTIAEIGRDEAGVLMPTHEDAIARKGADSPEGAVEGMLQSMADLDLVGIVGWLSPNSFAALQDYLPAFVDLDDLAPPPDFPVQVTLSNVRLDADVDGDHAVVAIEGFDLDVNADGLQLGLTVGDGCVALRGDLELFGDPQVLGEPLCTDTIQDQLADPNGLGALFGVIGGYPTPAVPGMDDLPEPPTTPQDLGVTAHRVDGKWYVAPIGTMLDVTNAYLGSLDRDYLDAMADFLEELPDLMADALTQGFGATSELIETPGITVAPYALNPTYPDEDTVAILLDMAGLYTGDPILAECTVATLQTSLSPQELQALATSYVDGDPLSEAATTQLFFAIESCSRIG